LTERNLEGNRIRGRIERLRIRILGLRGDAILVTHLPNIAYLCGFTGSNGILLVTPGTATLFTDGRYAIQAPEEVAGTRVRVRIAKRGLLSEAGAALRASPGKQRVLFPPSKVSVGQFQQLRAAAGSRVLWSSDKNCVEELRAVKDARELEEMRQAARLISEVFDDLTGLVQAGIAENEIAAEAEYRMRRKGAAGPSFESIVAAGPRSALPHARPTPRLIGKNELVVLDLGAILRGYCSDMTRTVFVGRASRKVRGWYRAVLEAQLAAIDALAAGVKAGDVDAAARRTLRRHGLAQAFTHSTGHGLGLEVHEIPRLARGDTAKLAAGNVVTIEPGVYIEGVGGIRIEDDVAIGEHGIEILTRATKEFLEL
jgi:Xaa-Pro aminopeptidase